jgi:4-hydroxy 2-oxovalerate aldolase
MKNARILDCTLRDGGRLIDCAFPDRDIKCIADKLSRAGIDIVELGFLRDGNKLQYSGDSTFFTDADQISPFIPQGNHRTEYVAFIDFDMFDFGTLKSRSDNALHGLRVGFTKKDCENRYDDLIAAFQTVKDRGYKLFIQGVNSLNYSDIELLRIIETVNAVKPASFGIVDTYGAMYADDVSRLYGLIDHNLDRDIAIDFHSHNNFQLSFSFAQEVIRLSNGVREVILDATLGGMGKGAGNLNTELIADFLVRKMNYGYDTDLIFDAIDEYLHDLREKFHWGYSPAALLSGIYRSHPNNVIYLTQKFRLDTKDVKNILSMLDEQERQRYDYDKIDRLTEEYSDSKYDDGEEIRLLRAAFADRKILILAPGNTLNTHRAEIDRHIGQKSPVIISVNFSSAHENSFCFYANKKRYAPTRSLAAGQRCIVTSDIAERNADEIVINYHSLVNREFKLFNNSVMMLLNLLKRIGANDVAIAGMDGFSKEGANYFDKSYNVNRLASQYDEINPEISKMLRMYMKTVAGKCTVSFVTPGMFASLVQGPRY